MEKSALSKLPKLKKNETYHSSSDSSGLLWEFKVQENPKTGGKYPVTQKDGEVLYKAFMETHDELIGHLLVNGIREEKDKRRFKDGRVLTALRILFGGIYV